MEGPRRSKRLAGRRPAALPSTSFRQLPPEVQLGVLRRLDRADLCALLTVSRALFDLAAPLLWRRISGCEHFAERVAKAVVALPKGRSDRADPGTAAPELARAALYADSIRSVAFLWDASPSPPRLPVRHLAALLSRAPNVRSLELAAANDEFDSRVAAAVRYAAANLTSFTLLNVSFAGGAPGLLKRVLGSMPHLESLTMSGCSLHRDSFLLAAELEMPRLRELKLVEVFDACVVLHPLLRNPTFAISQDGLSAFLDRHVCKLDELAVENCRENAGWWGLGPAAVASLADRIADPASAPRMRRLSLDFGRIDTPDDIVRLAGALGTGIRDLHLGFRDRTSPETFTAVFDRVAESCTALESLFYQCWSCDGIPADDVVRAIETGFPNLLAVSLCTNPPLLTADHIRRLAPRADKGLRYLAVSGFPDFGESDEFRGLQADFVERGSFLRCRIVEDVRVLLVDVIATLVAAVNGGLDDSDDEDGEGGAEDGDGGPEDAAGGEAI